MSEPVSLPAANRSWLEAEPVQFLLRVLGEDGEEARVNGGAVRNAFLGAPVVDVDISTTARPQEVIRRLAAHDVRTVPTGVEHGTVMAVVSGKGYEVTTLRQDIDTDGRHAVVRFGRDWTRDAERRDFTMNALYCDADGFVIDPIGGMADLQAQHVRFIGDAQTRIREDFLRILRFFRFYAHYGTGRPDEAGLKACAKLKENLQHLSAERVWQELSKLLAAPDPARALLWMRTTGVLTQLLPETANWGIDLVPDLIAVERDHGWHADGIVRLMTMLPPDARRLATLGERLKLPGVVRQRLANWADSQTPSPALDQRELARLLYRGSQAGIADAMRLEIVRLTHVARTTSEAAQQDRAAEDGARTADLMTFVAGWQRPTFPVKGRDLKALGIPSGPEIGEKLAELETRWIEADFKPDKEELLNWV